jgi:hypothetical protein
MALSRIGLLLICALALQSPTSAQQASAEQAASDPATQMLSIPVYQSAAQTRVMVTIGDGPPGPMVFDTGSDSNDIIEPLANRLKLAVVGTDKSIDGATNRSTTLPVLAIPDFAISGIPLGTVKAFKRAPFDVDSIGLVGPYIFSGRLVTLEFGLSRFRVSDASATPDGRAYKFAEGLPAVPVSIAGIAIIAHFDSGADTALSLPTRYMKRLAFIEKPYVAGVMTSMLGSQLAYQARIRGDVRIGPLLLHNPKVGFAGERPYANVGLLILRKLTFAVDPKRQLTWLFDPNVDRLPMVAYAGHYGEFAVTNSKGHLTIKQEDLPPASFVPLGSGLFENRDDGARIQFRREGKRSTGLWRISPKGRIKWVARTA